MRKSDDASDAVLSQEPATLAAARRGRLVAVIVSIAVVSSVLGWIAGSAIQSPSANARAEAPEASLITAPVERRVLTSAVVARGEGRYSAAADVVVDADLGEEGSGVVRPVVTGRIPAAGVDVADGAVALEVSGRPIFLLQGHLPMYRRLRPDTTGPDVRQLEEALGRLGFFTGAADDVFDEATERGVTAMYLASGYKPVGPSEDDLSRLSSAQAEVSAAEQGAAAAKVALAAVLRGPSRSEIVAAEGEVEIARAAVERAKADRQEAVDRAEPEDRDRVRREHDMHVLEAENRLRVAEARLAELLAPRDAGQERAAVDQAVRTLDSAKAGLAGLEADIGVQLPRGEVVFVPSVPRKVERVHVTLGAEPSGPALTLSGADLELAVSVSGSDVSLIEPGDPAQIDDEGLGIDMPGIVATIATATGIEGAPAGAYAVRVRPTGDRPERLLGANVRVRIPVSSTDGEVLAVPVAAVWAAADGSSRVRLATGGGRTEDVAVRVGLAAEGFVEVEPLNKTFGPGDEVVLGVR